MADVEALVNGAKAHAEHLIADHLNARGLTATTPKHIWLEEGTETFEIREGSAPPDDKRPRWLQGLDLDICKGKLAGTVRRRKPDDFMATPLRR